MSNLAMISSELIHSLVNLGRDCVLCVVAGLSGLTGEEAEPPSEPEDLDQTCQLAQSERKNVLVIYKGTEGNKNNSIAGLLESSDFRSLVGSDFVSVVLASGDEANTHSTTLVFADEKGRPYYAIDEELASGLDWLEVEIRIAEEAKKHLIPLIDHIPDKLTSEADYKMVGLLMASLPDGIENFHKPYEKLLNKTLADDTEDMSGIHHMLARRERQRALNDAIWSDFSSAINKENLPAEGALEKTLAQKVNESGDATPFLHQLVGFLCQVLLDRNVVDAEISELSALSEKIDKVFTDVLNKNPNSKLAENIRRVMSPACKVLVHDVPLVRAQLKESDTEKCAEILQLIDSLEAQSPTPLRCVQQYYEMLRAETYDKMGDLGKVEQSAQRILQLDPSTPCADEAGRILNDLKKTSESPMQAGEQKERLRPLIDGSNCYRLPRFVPGINWGNKVPDSISTTTKNVDEVPVK